MTRRVHNFSAGPSTLPLPVLKQIQREMLALPGVGMSVLELSHRSAPFVEIVERAEANVRALYGVPDGYRVVFLQGGASLQFSMVALNFLRGQAHPADYVLTGSWAQKAVKEARREGTVRLAWDGTDEHFSRVPAPGELDLDPQAAYVHVTSNETIQGVQFPDTPETGGVPLVCDLSSDVFSRPIPIEKYALIYAGAQKNAGAAGATLVIARDDFLKRAPEGQHAMLDYRLLAEQGSLYNTPPSFAIYTVMLVTQWLLDEVGGLAAVAERNREKADTLYGAIDASGGFYRGHARADSRSRMNVTWRLPNEDLERRFLDGARACDLHELKGHRSVGGVRASIYNAMPLEGVRALAAFMADFQKRNG